MPSDWNSVPDPGGPAANRDEAGYNIRKGYVDLGQSILAVGDQFVSGETTYTVQSINLQYLGVGSGVSNNDTVTFVGGTTITLAALVGGSWANGSFTPTYKKTYGATQLTVSGPQW
jgi:hypothetical protein